MQTRNSFLADTPARQFGRKGISAAMAAERQSAMLDDLKLFALTFAAGFLFVSLYLA